MATGSSRKYASSAFPRTETLPVGDTSPIILFGGTFDPPTRAHAALPPRAAELLGAHRLLYVPAAVSPHKIEQPPTSAEHRLAMLGLSIKGIDFAEIRTLELDREGPSYSVDTVSALRSEFDDSITLRLLIGDDQAVAFNRWKDWKTIIKLAEPVVLPRQWSTADAFAEALSANGSAWTDEEIQCWLDWRLDLPCMDMCSEEVREHLEAGEPVDDQVDPAVLEYIAAHGLYR